MGTLLLKYRSDVGVGVGAVSNTSSTSKTLNSSISCTDTLNHTDPQAVKDAHAAFLVAGARYLTTNTFCCDSLSLKASGYDLRSTSERGAALAVKARAAFQSRGTPNEGIVVMGSLGPGWLSPEKGEVPLKDLVDDYARRAEGLMAGGVDGFVIETVQDLQQAETALRGIEKAVAADALYRPVFMTASVSKQGRYIGQHELKSALKVLKSFQTEGLGFNCGEGPEHLESALAALQGFQGAILLKPNAGRPQALCTPRAFSQILNTYLHAPDLPTITHWGGCCGASPAHIQALGSQ